MWPDFFGQRRNATPYKFSPSSRPPSFVISPNTRNQTLGSTTIDDRNKEGRKMGESINPSSVMLFGWTGTHIATFLCTSDKKNVFFLLLAC
jgi:hypothetical protein